MPIRQWYWVTTHTSCAPSGPHQHLTGNVHAVGHWRWYQIWQESHSTNFWTIKIGYSSGTEENSKQKLLALVQKQNWCLPVWRNGFCVHIIFFAEHETLTVLYTKTVDCALFHSWWIFWATLSDSPTYTISTWSPILADQFYHNDKASPDCHVTQMAKEETGF